MKVSLNISDDLVKMVDARAEALHITRTAWISMTISQKLQQDDVLDTLPELLRSMQEMRERDAARIEGLEGP